MRVIVNAQCIKSLKKHACGEVFIYTSRSDREALVHHHCLSLPKPHRVISRFFSVSGRVFLSEDREQKQLTILLMMSWNYSHVVNCSNFGTASWNFVAA